MNRESGGGSRSAGQLGDQRGATLVTSPSTRPVYWQGLMCTRALSVPGHLWSSTGWVEGGWGNTTGLGTSLAARQSALRAPACLLDGRGDTHNAPAHPPRSTVRAQARWRTSHSEHWPSCSLHSLMYLCMSDSQLGAPLTQGALQQLQGHVERGRRH